MKRLAFFCVLLTFFLAPQIHAAPFHGADANPLNATTIKGVYSVSTSPSLTNHGATTAGTIQAQIDACYAAGGGVVEGPPGTYTTSTTIRLKTGVILRSSGRGHMHIRLANGADVPVVETDGFAANYAAFAQEAPHSFGLIGVTIDGNRDNQTDTAADGLRIYGCRYILDDVEIRDCKGRGFFSSYKGTGEPAALTGRGVESFIGSITIVNCQRDGMVFHGPHDSHAQRLLVSRCYDDTGSVLAYAARGLWLAGSFSEDGSLSVGYLHSYSNGVGFEISDTAFLKADTIVADANYKQGAILGVDHGQISQLHVFKNGRIEDGSFQVEMPNDYWEIGSLYIDHRYSTTALTEDTDGGGGLKLSGNYNAVGNISAWGAGASASDQSSIGVWVTGSHNTIAQGRIFDWDRTGSAGLKVGAGSQLIFLDISATISNCTTAFVSDQGGEDRLNRYRLSISANEGAATGQVIFSGNGPAFTFTEDSGDGVFSPRWDILARDLAGSPIKVYKSHFRTSVELDLNTTSPQTFTIRHRQITTPNQAGILWSIRHQAKTSAFGPAIDYVRVTNITATTVDIIVKLNAALGAGETAWLVVDIQLTP